MPKVVVSPLAQADIDEIWDHIARDSRVNADRFVDRIEQRFDLLAANPVWAWPATIFGRASVDFAMRATWFIIDSLGRYRSRPCGARRTAAERSLEALAALLG